MLTHGEPHRGNTIVTATGVVLVDWDTCLLAPPERDLWLLVGEEPGIRERYATRTGTTLDSGCSRRTGCAGTSPTSRRACGTCGHRTPTTRTAAPAWLPSAAS